MFYKLTAKKKDWDIWRDFVQINREIMYKFYMVGETKDEIKIVFKPEVFMTKRLFNAFQAEKEMGTKFTIEVVL